jgi:hypothetical protein
MHPFRSVVIASFVFGGVSATAIALPSHAASPFNSPLGNRGDRLAIALPQSNKAQNMLVSLEPSGLPIVQTEDWTTKDINLPWNQVALDKSFGAEDLVVFTKSYKFKMGFVSNRKERVHARWTQKTVEIFIMRGRDCGLVFGCESATSYGLPKRIKISSGGQDYFLKTVEQNTYELTPDLKQAINQTSGRLIFKVDERVNFEIQEEAIPGLKNLFAMPPIATSTPSAPSTPPANPSVPSNPSTPANPPAVSTPASAPANANAPLF